ncbi:MAG: hypothetical protein HOP12_15415 [Candidatus Eisenbacteria bacterium]|uniref:DM13 domain-containing protein n=1 Tax=Eiseniibacteriota bacterium TaxID=2212470 RepID=A0A849SP12_UNCEI|nr:hypothetical protein [Candidatus Eisenbacteria bacterium]
MESVMTNPIGMMSTTFNGPEVKGGSIIAMRSREGITLSLSDDFMIPGAPAPHWQVVDAAGNAYLLQRLQVVNDRVNRTITVPAYVRQVSSVRIYCAFAEVVLGEVTFSSPVM